MKPRCLLRTVRGIEEEVYTTRCLRVVHQCQLTGFQKTMTFYENWVTQTQQNYSMYYQLYQQGGTPYQMSHKAKPAWEEQIRQAAKAISEADAILVGGASGLSAAGGGDFYYSDTPSFYQAFGRFAKKYGVKNAFKTGSRKVNYVWKTRSQKPRTG